MLSGEYSGVSAIVPPLSKDSSITMRIHSDNAWLVINCFTNRVTAVYTDLKEAEMELVLSDFPRRISKASETVTSSGS